MAPAVVNARPHVAAGIVFALPIEAGRFADRAREQRSIHAAGLTVHEGLIGDATVAWVVGGAGIDPATRACRLLIDGHRPRLILTAGFAGALSPDIARGGVVRPVRALRLGHGPIDLAYSKGRDGTRPLSIVTVDDVVSSADARQRLAQETTADLVDMETWGVAAEAQSAGIACECIRVVSDTPREELPQEVSQLTAARSPWHRFGAALRTVGRRPSAALDLWQLWERAVVDSRTLADALEHRLATLPAMLP